MTVPASPDTFAPAIQIFGPALVSVARFYSSGDEKWYPVGYTRNGVDQTEEAFWLDIPGDEYGGDDGPPLDVQFLGAIARVRCEFTKWNVNNVNFVRARVEDVEEQAPPGQVGEGSYPCSVIGGLQILGGYSFALRVEPQCLTSGETYGRYTFPFAIPRAPIEINHATKFSTVIMEFECHRSPSNAYHPNVIYYHEILTAP